MNGAGNAKIRLQLALARSGVSSRRHAEDMIRAGRVSVNGETVVEMGVRVDPRVDVVLVDGAPLQAPPARRRTVLLNKPVGYLCAASDGHGGRLVTELVADVPGRLVPVGRLDKDSSGLLLLSDDGDLVAHLTHPRYGHRKVYMVEVSGRCDGTALALLRGPMEIDGYRTRPAEVDVAGRHGMHTRLRFTLGEGRNRQIRKMCAAVGLNVVSLKRVALDGLNLGDLAPGEYRELTEDEVASLRRGGPGAGAPPAARPPRAQAPRPRRGRDADPARADSGHNSPRSRRGGASTKRFYGKGKR